MNLFSRGILTILVGGTLMAGAYTEASSQPRPRRTLQGQVRDLQATVRSLLQHQRDLEARIAVLERLNLAPSPEAMRASYTKSSRDAVINDLANIGANAYQYKIRPTTMGGGGGSYIGFKIPKALLSREYATFEASASADSVVLRGAWTMGTGTVQAVVGTNGRLEQFIYTGDFE